MEQIPPSDDAATTNSHRFEASQSSRILGPNGGKAVDLGSLGVRFMIRSEESGGGFSLVEHPIPPRTLAAPLHRHANEDEYSYVLEGGMGAQLGDEVVYAEVGYPGLLAPRPVAHLLERWGRAVPDPGDHLPWRIRASVRGSGRRAGGKGR